MSRDIQEFINAFGMGFSIGDRISQRHLQADGLRRRYAADDLSNPELNEFDRKYGASATGRPTTGGGFRLPNLTRQVTPRAPQSGLQFAQGGAVPDDENPLSTPGDRAYVQALETIAAKRLQRATDLGRDLPDAPPLPDALDIQGITPSGRARLAASGTQAPDQALPVSGQLPARPAAFDRPMTVEPPAYEAANAIEGTGGIPRFAPVAGEGRATTAEDTGGGPQAGGGASQGSVRTGATPARATAGGAAPGGQAGGAASSGGATSGAPAAGGKGNGRDAKRKSLKDQSRVNAFDPTDAGDVDEADEVTKTAIKGGMQFAAQMFGLGGDPNNPNTQEGVKAFYGGTGAPDPQQMQQVDQIVQQQAPDDYNGPLGKAKLQIRRMEIMYRWAVQNGNTDRANKMAFEIMQFAAGTAATYGQQAVTALQNGDMRTGATLVAQALDEVPDGYNVQAGPNGEMIYTDSKGQVFDRKQLSPEQMFNAAMGLSNRSMYWKLLAERAGMTPAAQKASEAGVKNELRQSRMETEELRRKRLQQQIDAGVGGGRRGRAAAAPAGPSPVSETLADIRSRMPARGGVTPPGQTSAAPPQGDEPADEEDDTVDDTVEQGDSPRGDGSGNPPRPANAPAAIPSAAKPPPRSVLRLKDPPASQGAIPPVSAKTISIADKRLDPEGAASGAPGPKAQAAPNGAQQRDDGLPPRPAPAEAPKFNEPHPLAEFNGKDPYADLLAGIDPKTGKHNPAITQYWATKQGRAEKSAILAEQRTLNRDIAAWEKREKAFQKANAPAKGGKSGPLLKPSVAKQTADLGVLVDEALKGYGRGEDGVVKPSTLNDGKTDMNEARDLTMEMITNNPNLTPQRALDHLSRMLITDTDDEKARSFTPLGYTSDKPDAMVVISPRGQPNIKLAISQDAYRRLDALAAKRYQTGKAGPPPNEPKGTWSGVRDAMKLGAAKFRPMLTVGPGLTKAE